MIKKTYKRFDLAEEQLEAAIVLFCSGSDKFSVITLAGAADVIFNQLVTRQNKDNFTQILMKKENGQRSFQEVGKEINNLLGINTIKHLNPGDDEHVTIDVDECALAAILKALVNYNMLNNKNENLILGFRAWARTNLDLTKYNIPGTSDNKEE